MICNYCYKFPVFFFPTLPFFLFLVIALFWKRRLNSSLLYCLGKKGATVLISSVAYLSKKFSCVLINLIMNISFSIRKQKWNFFETASLSPPYNFKSILILKRNIWSKLLSSTELKITFNLLYFQNHRPLSLTTKRQTCVKRPWTIP